MYLNTDVPVIAIFKHLLQYFQDSLIYHKVPKFSDARKLGSNLPKIQTKRPNLMVLWIRKFSRDFYSAIFSFSNYSRLLKYVSKYSCSRLFPWVEDRRSLYFMRETN